MPAGGHRILISRRIPLVAAMAWEVLGVAPRSTGDPKSATALGAARGAAPDADQGRLTPLPRPAVQVRTSPIPARRSSAVLAAAALAVVALAVVAAIVGTVAAVGAIGGTPPTEQSAGNAATPGPSSPAEGDVATPVVPTPVVPPQPLLTGAALEHAVYRIEGRAVRLSNGSYPDVAFSVELREFAFGDLDGDALPDAAAILATNFGGSGTLIQLAAVINRSGAPRHLTSADLGDRVLVENIVVEGGEILITMITHGPDEPLCCPTVQVQQSYRLQGAEIVRTG